MGRKQRRIKAGLFTACFQDQVDGLWRQRPSVDVAPLIDAPEHRAVLDLRFSQPTF